MPTKKTMVVPCIVNMRLKTCGETRLFSRNRKLKAHHDGFQARDYKKHQRITDVHQADLLVVDGGDPAVQHLQRERACFRRWMSDRLVR